MGNIMFAVLAEPAKGLGSVTLAEDDIEALTAATEGTHIPMRSRHITQHRLQILARLNGMLNRQNLPVHRCGWNTLLVGLMSYND